jgi:DNA-nicking Smr family endonuclease
MSMAGMKDFGDLKSFRDRLKVEDRLRAIEKAEREKRERMERENAVEFRSAVKDVNELPESDRYVWRPQQEAERLAAAQARARILSSDEEIQAVLRESMLSDQFDVDGLLDEEPTLSWSAPGVGPDVVKKLRKRHWQIEDEVDLHGLTRDLARRVVDAFLQKQQKRHALRAHHPRRRLRLGRGRTGAARHGPQLAGADRGNRGLLRGGAYRRRQRRPRRTAASGTRGLSAACLHLRRLVKFP